VVLSERANMTRVVVDMPLSVDEHINVKETRAGIETIRAVRREDRRRNILLKLAVDNVTARKALALGFYPREKELSAELWQLHKELSDAGWILEVVYCPGDFQPADEPSRGKQVDEMKVRRCIDLLLTTTKDRKRRREK
jgi:hypothetical protein